MEHSLLNPPLWTGPQLHIQKFLTFAPARQGRMHVSTNACNKVSRQWGSSHSLAGNKGFNAETSGMDLNSDSNQSSLENGLETSCTLWASQCSNPLTNAPPESSLHFELFTRGIQIIGIMWCLDLVWIMSPFHSPPFVAKASTLL